MMSNNDVDECRNDDNHDSNANDNTSDNDIDMQAQTHLQPKPQRLAIQLPSSSHC